MAMSHGSTNEQVRGGAVSRSPHMYERAYGPRYHELGPSPDVTDIAQAIRRDIRHAVQRGELPGRPVTYGVRTSRFAGGQAIDIRIRDWPGEYLLPEAERRPHHWITPAAAKAVARLETILHAYNHDGSEPLTDYFDVRYYGSVEFTRGGGKR